MITKKNAASKTASTKSTKKVVKVVAKKAAKNSKKYLLAPAKTHKSTRAGLYHFLLAHPKATMTQLQEAAGKQRGKKVAATEREVKIFLPRVAKIFAKVNGKKLVVKGNAVSIQKAA